MDVDEGVEEKRRREGSIAAQHRRQRSMTAHHGGEYDVPVIIALTMTNVAWGVLSVRS